MSASRSELSLSGDALASPPPADATMHGSAPKIIWSRRADHPQIAAFLASNIAAFSAAEFESSLDDPQYEPSDRLLIVEADRIVAHAHIVKRAMRFGASRMPVGRIRHIAVAPEFRGRGYAAALIGAAEEQIAEDGAPVALISTARPECFLGSQWAIIAADSATHVAVRDLVPHLSARLGGGSALAGSALAGSALAGAMRPRRSMVVRRWRHFELDALVEIYRQECFHRIGPLERGEAYFQWLVSRELHHHIYVAGPRLVDLQSSPADIAGYAVIRGSHILEIFTRGGDPLVALHLLDRVCADAIEQNREYVTLHAPADSPLHELAIAAGGAYTGLSDGPTAPRPPLPGIIHLAKILDPHRCLTAASEELWTRWHCRADHEPGKLVLQIGDDALQLTASRRCVRVDEVEGGELAPDARALSRQELAAAIFGRGLARTADLPPTFDRTFFPRTPTWISPFDDPVVAARNL
jgi:ribosomal protein S18 acetylase RimI-like enzyme